MWLDVGGRRLLLAITILKMSLNSCSQRREFLETKIQGVSDSNTHFSHAQASSRKKTHHLNALQDSEDN